MKIDISIGENGGPAETPYTPAFMTKLFIYASIGVLILLAIILIFSYGLPATESLLCHAAPNWNWNAGVCK